MSYTLYETITQSKILNLIGHNDISDDEKKQLKGYLKNYDKKKQAFKVEYSTAGLDIGRKYAKGSLSLQNFKKKIRESLIYDTHIDVDIKNCHLVLLSQYCAKNNLICKEVDNYVKFRTKCLQGIMNDHNVSRKTAKELVLVMMYGGNVNEYTCNNGFDIEKPLPKWINDLELEFKTLIKMVCSLNETIYKDVKKLKKKDYVNKESSCLSYVLQQIEDNIITNASTKLTHLGYTVETLCFDGVLILKQDMTTDLFEEISSYCYDKTGYNVEFEVKPMEKHYEVQTEKFDFSNFPFEKLDYFDQIYCDSLKFDSMEKTYQMRKTYVEKFLCKVQQPEPMFILQNGIYKNADFLCPQACSNFLKAVMSGYKNQYGADVSFYDRWSTDVTHRIYRTYDFLPFNMEKPSDSSIFNVFEGFNDDIYGEQYDKPTITKKITPYLDLVQQLCGGDDEHAMYFHRFIAQIFQEPNKKVPICIIFKGKQGTGKNIMLDAIGNMLNSVHYITSSKPTDFFGDHAEGYYRKLLVNLNEAEGKDTFDFEGKMKSFISEDTITINPKNVRPTTIRNMARTIITTNKTNPIPIDVKSKDRRYVVFQTTDEYLKKSSKFWTGLYNHMRNPDTMRALYQFFMSIDNKDYDWIKRRPLTKAYKDMCNLYSPVEALFFEEFYDKEKWTDLEIKKSKDDTITIPSHELFVMYEQFCKRNRFLKDDTKATSSRSFISKMTELELPIDRLKTNGDICVKFCPQEIYDFIEMKRWINSYKFDEEEQENVDAGVDAPDDYFA